ncbi:MAG TPA: DUF1638 domain-containing protein [Bryobacteraceae bacterium]|nr:DUF1638 domain-containing protein [Bryobacteraceae bacterium]
MRLKLIGCEVLYRELCAAAARSVNEVDVEFLPKGLHDLGCSAMLSRLQQAVDEVDGARYESVALGYALCGNGLAGLRARSLPLIVPRAHDCITLFLGSGQRYLDYFNSHPGVYFQTSGWIERGRGPDTQISLRYDDLVERYGEEDARYLRQELTRHYRQLTFIEMGVEPDDRFEQQARAEAAERGWAFEKVPGDMRLIRQLVDGPWDERDFLAVGPGLRVVPRHDDGIIAAEPA